MSDRIKVYQVVLFFERPWPQPSMEQLMQMTVFVTADAFGYLTPRERGNPHAGYEAHIRKNYFTDIPVPIKSINTVYLTKEQVELIK